MTDNNELTVLELNDVKYRLGKSIYAELDMSLERFVELLGRDLYCPTLPQAPTSSTVSYKDTDDTVNTFQAGQPCRWQEGNAWRLAVCTNNIGTSATWYVLPTKVSELTNDAEYVTESELEGKGYATENQVAEVKKEVNQYTDEKVAALVNGAPETLDTLDELAAALKDNKDIVDVLNASIGNKQDKIEDLETIRQGAGKGTTALQSSGGEIKGDLIIGNGDEKTWIHYFKKDINAKFGAIGVSSWHELLFDDITTVHTIIHSGNYSSYALPLSGGTINGQLDITENITALGNVGIGTTSPSEKLHVNGNIKVENGSFIGNLTGTATKATQDGNGKVISDTYAVKDEVLGYDDVGGSVEDAVEYLTTSEQNLSDAEKERVKTNIGVNVPIIDHGTNDSTFSLTPNKYHRWGTMSSLSISLAPASDNTVVSNYGFEFTSGATPTSFSYPSDVQFIHEIKIEANKRYQGIISNGMGVLVSVNKL